ncbi:MAG TPA: MerR family transcriptional regulator [Thermomicrobiales bacterium]|nr:MerR family transcriptional regulator [Thermomicrobiales bacterium]
MKPENPRLTIGQFSRRSLLSPKALRLYDHQGLLVPAEVDPETGYRRYRESQLADARLIARMRQLDMPLADVAAVLARAGDQRSELLVAWWDRMERRRAAQRDLLISLLITMAGKERNFEMFEIIERDTPDQTVLTEQRHTTVEGLTAWFDDCMPRLHGIAADHGGIAGPAFIIYHGEVNEESDGPVEVCVPVHADRATSIPAATRVESAHREAYTRITKAMVEYPQILGAYDAVEHWVAENGREITGSPREVYFVDFMAAADDDEACDIAFPIAN